MQTGVFSDSEIHDNEQIGEGGADINVLSYLQYDQEQFLILSLVYLGESQVITRINE
jgi:hypothetical protein